MKKTSIILSLFAFIIFFSSCKKDDDEPTEKEVVDINKVNDDALLLVTFGSTYDAPHETYKKMVEAYKKEFPKKDVYLGFTSTTCITRWGAKTGEYFVSPDIWLEALAKNKYKRITVQSLHVIPGEEYLILKDKYIKEFKTAHPEIPTALGAPLLVSDQDIQEVGDVLINAFKEELDNGEAVAFMGHGNPKDEFNGEGDKNVNRAYEKIQNYMQNKKNSKMLIVGTVDYEPMLIDKILEQVKKDVPSGSIINLTPLMSIAGDHAENDMAGDIDAEAKPEEQSWKIQLSKAGYKVTDDNCVIKGLGDYPEILNVWIRHTHDILK